ncbi:MAG: adenylate cyclase regulatory domain-containing protein [Ilumatobacter sp.]
MATVEDFIAAGLYDPACKETVGRLELLTWLDAKGVTVADMVDALASDSLGAMAGDRRLVPGERLTLADVGAQVGIDPSELESMAVAFGLVSVQGSPDGEIGITLDEARAASVFEGLAQMFSRDEARSLIRVIGSSAGRMAEASVSMFLADVESRMLSDGSSEIDLAHAVEDAIGLIDGFMESLDPIYRRHLLQAIERSRETTVSLRERFTYRYAVGFVDLVGFTEISGSMSGRELAAFLRDFEGRAYDVVTAAGARVVKLIGDEVMFVASDAEAACRAGAELLAGFGSEHERVLPRGGLAYGEMLVRGGDYYGSVVNLASRLTDEAVPQELLVTEELAAAAPSCSFEPAGRRMVKGFDSPIAVKSLRH